MATYFRAGHIVAFGNLLVKFLDVGESGDESRGRAVGLLTVEHQFGLFDGGVVVGFGGRCFGRRRVVARVAVAVRTLLHVGRRPVMVGRFASVLLAEHGCCDRCN